MPAETTIVAGRASALITISTGARGPVGPAPTATDLPTTGLAAGNLLRIAAAGGLEERTPAETLSDIGALATAGGTMTGALTVNHNLTTGTGYALSVNGTLTLNGTSFYYGTGSAAAHRTALGLGTSATSALIDDDTFASATSTNVPSAESVKEYVDAKASIDALGLAPVETLPTAATITIYPTGTLLAQEDFAADVGDFSAGTWTDADGPSGANGYMALAANTTADIDFGADIEEDIFVEFYVRFNGTATAADGTSAFGIYLLPNGGSTSANSNAVWFLTSQTTSPLTTNPATADRSKSWYYNLNTVVNSRNFVRREWHKIGIYFDFSAHTWDLYIDGRLAIPGIVSRNAAAANSRIARFFTGTTCEGVDVAHLRVLRSPLIGSDSASWQTIIHDDFVGTGESVDGRRPKFAAERWRKGAVWRGPSNAALGNWTVEAGGLTPSAVASSYATIHGGTEGDITVNWTEPASGNTYLSVIFRLYEGEWNNAADSFWNATYFSNWGAGTKLRIRRGFSAFPLEQGDPTGVTMGVNLTHVTKIAMRGNYVYFYIDDVLQLTADLGTDARGLLGEVQVGLIGAATAGGTVQSFRFDGLDSQIQSPYRHGDIITRAQQATVQELYIGDGSTNWVQQKGLCQLAHRASGEPAMGFACLLREVARTEGYLLEEQRGNITREDDSLGSGYMQFTRSNNRVVAVDSIKNYSVSTAIVSSNNIAPDQDLNPFYFETAGGRAYDGTSVVTYSLSPHDWTTRLNNKTLPLSWQMVGDDGADTMRITCCVVNVANWPTSLAKLQTKHNGSGDSISTVVSFDTPTDLTTYTTRNIYLVEPGETEHDNTVLIGLHHNFSSPPALTVSRGTLLTDQSGDINTDGYNESRGWYEVKASGGQVAASLTPSYLFPQPQFLIDRILFVSGVTVNGTAVPYDAKSAGNGKMLVTIKANLAASANAVVIF